MSSQNFILPVKLESLATTNLKNSQVIKQFRVSLLVSWMFEITENRLYGEKVVLARQRLRLLTSPAVCTIMHLCVTLPCSREYLSIILPFAVMLQASETVPPTLFFFLFSLYEILCVCK